MSIREFLDSEEDVESYIENEESKKDSSEATVPSVAIAAGDSLMIEQGSNKISMEVSRVENVEGTGTFIIHGSRGTIRVRN